MTKINSEVDILLRNVNSFVINFIKTNKIDKEKLLKVRYALTNLEISVNKDGDEDEVEE